MSETAAERRRIVTWDDPAITIRKAGAMSGLAIMQAVQSGALPHPPVAKLLGIRMTEVSDGRIVCELEPGEHQFNPLGSVHGGVLVTLMDSSMSCAVHTKLGPGASYSTIDVAANFVRPVRGSTGTLRCEATVMHLGSRTATARCQVVDEAGQLYAHGTVTCLLRQPTGT